MVVWTIADFNVGSDRTTLTHWLTSHMSWPLLQGHVNVASATKPWSYFDCCQGKDSAHAFGCQVALCMKADMKKVYLVNMDGDNVFTERWLEDALNRAEQECKSMPPTWCQEVIAPGGDF